MVTAFFTWLAGVFSDPNDKQGSTKRICLFLFLANVMLLISYVTIFGTTPGLPNIPDSILNLIFFVIAVLTGATTIEKGIAAWRTINGPEKQ